MKKTNFHKKSLTLNVKHAGVLLVAILLISTSIVTGTIKFGTDGSGQYWGIGGKNVITNSNGYEWEPTGANIQNAIDNLTDGGTVYLPGETMTITDNIQLHDNITLKGVGLKTLIRPNGGDYRIVLGHDPLLDSDDNIVISDLQFDGTNDSMYGIYCIRGDNIRVVNCRVINCVDDCIAILENSSNVIVKDNYCGGTVGGGSEYSSGIEVQDGAKQVIVENNFCIGRESGINIGSHASGDALTNVTVINNYCVNNSDTGINIQGDASHTLKNVIVKNNIITTNHTSSYSAGINIRYMEHCVFDSNIIRKFDYGLYIKDASNIIISNNDISQSGSSNKQNLYLDGSNQPDNCTIIGNIFDDGSISGRSHIIQGNTLRAGTSGELKINSASRCIITGNKFVSSGIGLRVSPGFYLTITDNLFAYSDTSNSNLRIESGHNITVADNLFIQNVRGIWITAAIANLDVHDNKFLLNSEYDIYHPEYAKSVYDNLGYITENGGANTSTDDGGTITHGLAGTPTYVICTCNESAIVAVTNLGASTFTVSIKDHAGNAVNGVTIFWRAFYEP